MPSDPSPSLEQLGWNDLFARDLSRLSPDLLPARVAAEDRGHLHLLGPGVPRDGILAGRLSHDALSRLELPAVGDWVGVRVPAGASQAVVVRVLPRLTRFVRQAPGRKTEARVIAANVDTVGIVTSADADLSAGRLQRYLAVVHGGGALPLIALSKADAALDLDAARAVIDRMAPGVPVVVTSIVDGRGVDALRERIKPGQTLALVGSSGVGKSSLTNALLGSARQATGAVREHDGRGRHVTTRRELFVLDGGGLVVDTPGMRELAAWADEGAGAEAGGDDITELASECRFRDCRHESEPGCAVLAAVSSGDLDDSRLRGHRKLERELAYQERRQDVSATIVERKRWKKLTSAYRHRPPKGSL